MSNKKLLITRPNHDPITHYLCEWNQEIIDFAKEKNIAVHDLKSQNATAANFISHLKKQEYDFIIFNGHGNPKQVTGHNNEILITSGENHELLNNKIVYCLSCGCAKDLGKKCAINGKGVFIGYSEDFALIRDKNMVSRPLSDEYAKAILKPANQTPLTILKGKEVCEAVKRAQKAFQDEILRLQNSESEIGSGDLVMALIWNLSALTICGNETAQI